MRIGGAWPAACAILGLTSADEGTLVERVLARVVIDAAVRSHNAAQAPD